MQKKYHIESTITDLRLCPRVVTIGERKFQSDETKAFIQFTLLHSLPTANSNDVGFFLPLLNKCIGTAQFQPLNKEHQLEGNPSSVFDGENRILGAMIMAYLPEIAGDDGEIPLFPTEAVPAKVIGVLWKREEDVQGILEDIGNNKEWKISMEVIREPSRDALVLVGRKEVYRSWDDNYEEISAAWSRGDRYNGEKVVCAIGGTGLEDEDYANFWGGALTFTPADPNATIDSFVAAVASKGEITAQKKNIAQEGEKISINSDATFGGTKLEVDGEQIKDMRQISLWAGDDGEESFFNLRWTIEERDGDIVQRKEYEFDPETGAIQKGDSGMKTEDIKQILAQLREEGWITQEEAATKEQAIRDEFQDFLNPEQVEQRVAEELTSYEEERKEREKAYSKREQALSEAGLKLTDKRAEKLREFEISDEGEDQCKNYIASLKNSVSEMETYLQEKEIDPTEDILAAMSGFDGKDDPQFQKTVEVAVAIRKPRKVEGRPMSYLGGSPRDKSGEGKYLF